MRVLLVRARVAFAIIKQRGSMERIEERKPDQPITAAEDAFVESTDHCFVSVT